MFLRFADNLAYLKKTNQSSIYSDKITLYDSSQSTTAVNGILYGEDITRTKDDQLKWWRVDLGSVQTVRVIDIYNRLSPNCKCRLHAVIVSSMVDIAFNL